MLNVYNIVCGKLDKRYLFSEFIERFKLLDIIVVYKNNDRLNKKQKKVLLKNNIELINIDDIRSVDKKYNRLAIRPHLIISYGITHYSDLLKFKDLSDNLIILSNSVGMGIRGKGVISIPLISKTLDIHESNVFLLYNQSSKKFIHKSNNGYKSLTIDQIITIISREIRLKKIMKKK